MQLNDFQNRFKTLMLDHPDTLASPPEDLAALLESGDINLSKRLSVYRNNIVGSLTDVMVAHFPLLDALVGREFMELMARSFILENPPQQGCLNLYGQGFDTFIENFELAKSLPYLSDVAAYEIAVNNAYHAQDDIPLKAGDLAAIAPEDLNDLTLKLRASVILIESKWPLLAIQDFCNQDVPQGTLSLDQGRISLMVYRPHLESKSVKLDEDDFYMLSSLHDGHCLGEALDSTLNAYPDFDFQAFLQKHIALETFKGL